MLVWPSLRNPWPNSFLVGGWTNPSSVSNKFLKGEISETILRNSWVVKQSDSSDECLAGLIGLFLSKWDLAACAKPKLVCLAHVLIPSNPHNKEALIKNSSFTMNHIQCCITYTWPDFLGVNLQPKFPPSRGPVTFFRLPQDKGGWCLKGMNLWFF